ncbi:MAG: RecQ family ATP-dependent DNA helicase, partial [Reichenbachiella sp.]
MSEAKDILKKYWGYDAFRPLQEEIIESVLEGKDTLALLPTGGGKSICFQVPGLMLEGVCLVISPLIALMQDQVQQLKKRGISAAAVTSGMPKREIDILLDNCVFGKVKFLYVSPERLKSDLFIERLKKMHVSLLAIDEAHCISQWGYDFRPSYVEIANIYDYLSDTKKIALTATATANVADDICEKLAFNEPAIFQKSFARANLSYSAFELENKGPKLIDILNNVKGSAIVYVKSRLETQNVAKYLYQHGISSDFYHAGLDPVTRNKKQDE